MSPTIRALFKDFYLGGLVDGKMEPESVKFLTDVAPEINTIYSALDSSFRSMPVEEKSNMAGRIAGVVMLALFGAAFFKGSEAASTAARAAKFEKLIKKWNIPEAEAKKILDAVARIFDKLENVNAPSNGLFRGGSSLQARLGVDVKAAADGLIHPLAKNGKPQGLSLNIHPLDPFIQKYGGAFPVNSLPEGLQALPSGKPGHFVIVPKVPMTFEELQRLLNQVKLGDFNVLP